MKFGTGLRILSPLPCAMPNFTISERVWA